MIIVYVTCSNRVEAKKISKALLDKRLAASVNIFPIESMYWWHGELKNQKEYVMLAKTIAKNFKKIKEEVENLHSYQIPCILSWEIDKANRAYTEWLEESCK